MRRPTKDPTRDTTADLVRAFQSGVKRHFAFLLTDPSATIDFRTQEFWPEGAVDVEPEAITRFFLSSASFYSRRIAGVIEFGDREYSINTIVGAAGNDERFALWEWVRAWGPNVDDVSNPDFVLSVDRVEVIVAAMASALAEVLPAIASADPSVIARIQEARAQRQREYQSQLREDDHRRARAKADEAFREGNYELVLKLLGPFEDLLTRAEVRKLAVARRRLADRTA